MLFKLQEKFQKESQRDFKEISKKSLKIPWRI